MRSSLGIAGSTAGLGVQRQMVQIVTPPAPPPAGVMGFGTQTLGGTGGTVYTVTTLDGGGAVGTFRHAVTQPGPRIVQFANTLHGTINLNGTSIDVEHPFLTIDGSTAASNGGQIRGGQMRILTHDVIIKYLKWRTGSPGPNCQNDWDAITCNGNKTEVSNIWLDHCTLIWGPDIGSMAILADCHDITLSWCILGEGLYYSHHKEGDWNINTNSGPCPESRASGHSKGFNITTQRVENGVPVRPSRITVHHCLLTNSDDRMPQIMSGSNIDFVNNVIYNWGKNAGAGTPLSLNLIKNYWRNGPRSTRTTCWLPSTSSNDPQIHDNAVYEFGNWMDPMPGTGLSFRGTPTSVYRTTRNEPYSMTSEEEGNAAYTAVLAGAGATLPVRDSVDQRIIDDVVNRVDRAFWNGETKAAPTISWPNL
jgi:pectate lyase